MLGASTRYALHAILELARSDENDLVSVACIARRRGIPEAALAKIFQRLVRSGFVMGMRGPRGGYRLVRPPADITVLDIMNVFEPVLPAADPGVEPGSAWDEGLQEFFGAVDGQVRCAFAAVTLDQLAVLATSRSDDPM